MGSKNLGTGREVKTFRKVLMRKRRSPLFQKVRRIGPGMAFPNRMIMLLFPPIPMKAKYMVVLFGILELYLGLSGRAPGVANFAHLGGMLFGFLLIQHWKKTSRR